MPNILICVSVFLLILFIYFIFLCMTLYWCYILSLLDKCHPSLNQSVASMGEAPRTDMHIGCKAAWQCCIVITEPWSSVIEFASTYSYFCTFAK